MPPLESSDRNPTEAALRPAPARLETAPSALGIGGGDHRQKKAGIEARTTRCMLTVWTQPALKVHHAAILLFIGSQTTPQTLLQAGLGQVKARSSVQVLMRVSASAVSQVHTDRKWAGIRTWHPNHCCRHLMNTLSVGRLPRAGRVAAWGWDSKSVSSSSWGLCPQPLRGHCPLSLPAAQGLLVLCEQVPGSCPT